MATAVEYPHIQNRASEPACFRRYPRFRISQLAAEHIANGWSAHELSRQHPELTLSEAYMGLAYFYDHQEEIEAEWAAEKIEFEAWERAHANDPLIQRLRRNGI